MQQCEATDRGYNYSFKIDIEPHHTVSLYSHWFLSLALFVAVLLTAQIVIPSLVLFVVSKCFLSIHHQSLMLIVQYEAIQ